MNIQRLLKHQLKSENYVQILNPFRIAVNLLTKSIFFAHVIYEGGYYSQLGHRLPRVVAILCILNDLLVDSAALLARSDTQADQIHHPSMNIQQMLLELDLSPLLFSASIWQMAASQLNTDNTARARLSFWESARQFFPSTHQLLNVYSSSKPNAKSDEKKPCLSEGFLHNSLSFFQRSVKKTAASLWIPVYRNIAV